MTLTASQRSFRRAFGRVVVLVALGVSIPGAAGATLIQVDWSVALSGAAGSGTVSGSLGTFDVTTPALQIFPLPSTLPASTSGLGLPTSLTLYSTTVGPEMIFQIPGPNIGVGSYRIAAGGDVPANPPTTCLFSGPPGECHILTVSLSSVATFDIVSSQNALESQGGISYTFTAVPEPGTLLLLGGGIAGLLAFGRTKRD